MVKPWNCPSCGGLVKRELHPDGLIIAKACRIAGACIFCETPLRGMRRVVCGKPECDAAYVRAYFRDRRFAKRAA